MHERSPAPLSARKILSFASVAGVLGYLLIAVAVFLPPQLAGHLGIGLVEIGSAWAVVRVIDIAVDPLLGLAMDRTRSRFGRYRLWLAIGTPILMAGIYALFEAPRGIGFGYLITWLLVFYVGVSILTVAHSAWAATLAPDYDQRSRMFGLIAMVFVIGGVLVLAFPLLAGPLNWSSSDAVRAMGWFVMALTPLVVIGVCTTTSKQRETTNAGHVRLGDIAALLKKPDLIRLLVAQTALTLGPGWMSALYLFFLVQARGFSLGQASALLLAYMASGVAGAPLTARLAMRIGKHRALMAVAIAFAIGLCTVVAVPKADIVATLPIMLWCGFMAAGFDMMIRAMLADLADEARLERGKDQTGLLYALNSAANKLASALAIGLTFPLLAAIGFDASSTATNSAGAIRGLELAFISGPVAFVILGALAVRSWTLDATRHAQILLELSQDRASEQNYIGR